MLQCVIFLTTLHSYHTCAHSSMGMCGYQPLGAVGDCDGAGEDTDTYRQKKKKKGPSLVMAIAKTIWKIMAMAAVLKLFQDLLLFVNPQILRYVAMECETHCADNVCSLLHAHTSTVHWSWKCEGLYCTFTFHRLLINFVSDTEVPAWKGYFYAAILFVVAITQAILLQQHFIRTYVAGMRTRTCVIAAVYSKVSIKMVVRHSDLAVLQWCL